MSELLTVCCGPVVHVEQEGDPSGKGEEGKGQGRGQGSAFWPLVQRGKAGVEGNSGQW